MPHKVKSFTLAELLVVMIITAIVVGLAFSVLRLVQKQLYLIQNNFEKSSALLLFEQKLWQDFNELHLIKFNAKENILLLASESDTVVYSFQEDFSLRNSDTLKLKLNVDKVYFEGKEVKNDTIDAISIFAKADLPDYYIFVSKKNDLTFSMNNDGL